MLIKFGEINTRGRFHQDFTSTFFANFLMAQKITNPNCKQIKAAQKTFVHINWSKILVK